MKLKSYIDDCHSCCGYVSVVIVVEVVVVFVISAFAISAVAVVVVEAMFSNGKAYRLARLQRYQSDDTAYTGVEGILACLNLPCENIFYCSNAEMLIQHTTRLIIP